MYFVQIPDDERGPYTLSELRHELEERRVREDDLVRKVGKKKLRPLKVLLQRRREAAERRTPAVAENETEKIGRVTVGWIPPSASSTGSGGYRSKAQADRPTLVIAIPISFDAILHLAMVVFFVLLGGFFLTDEFRAKLDGMFWVLAFLLLFAFALAARSVLQFARSARVGRITVDGEELIVHTRFWGANRSVLHRRVDSVEASVASEVIKDAKGRPVETTHNLVTLRVKAADSIELIRLGSKPQAERLAKTIRARLAPR